MGTTFTFKCTKCEYEVQSSGELDWGFLVVVKPFICKDCKEVVDVVIGEHGEVMKSADELSILKDDFNKCPICNGTNPIVWHPRYRKCPKCGGFVKREKGGLIECWDYFA